MSEEFIESPQQKRSFPRTIAVLQGALITIVVGYVLDLHRGVLKLNLYTEQFLLAVLGLAIALCFLITKRRFWDPLAAAGGLGICLYLAWRYPQLSTELTSRPLDGIVTSGILALLVLEGTRRMAGFSLVAA